MDSLDLFHTRQQYALGSFVALLAAELPDQASPDYSPTVLYRARAQLVSDPEGVLQSLPEDPDSLAVRAVRALASYVAAHKQQSDADKEKHLDELRDICVEMESEENLTPEVKNVVKVSAGTAFAREGEVEEALETLGAGAESQDLEAIALVVQIYLSIHRPDLARKEAERAKGFADDDLLLQLIEASIDLVTGKGSYANAHSFYTEQSRNVSLASTHTLYSRGITHLLRGELVEASGDFQEVLKQNKDYADALAAAVVVTSLNGKRNDSEALWNRLETEHPSHPLVTDAQEKSEAFDQAISSFKVPPVAVYSQ